MEVLSMQTTITENTICHGDNLYVTHKYISDKSIDLIYLDPPFNSNTKHNMLFSNEFDNNDCDEITVFEDTWRWDEKAK